ncbi:SulP family inorganic anion transporter, partial [Candidatus Woesearchaeota archaeon]|nr:SulP family inorganic anion transporter [Candidatus Woesearchaeota archaeon]
ANTKHKSDKELISQGIGNVILPFFQAIPATAAIARSAVNIREGAKTRYAGVIHALFVLLIVFFFSHLAKYIPKAFLAGILMYVSAKMINPEEWKMIFHTSRADTMVLGITFLLTVLTDLVLAVEIGMLLAVFLLFVRLTNLIDISHMEHYDKHTGINVLLNADPKIREQVSVYTLHGPFFFGTMNVFEQKINEYLRESKQYIVIRFKHVPFIDSTGVLQLNSFIHHRQKIGGHVFLSGLNEQVKEVLFKNKEFMHLMKKEHIFEKAKDAIQYISANYIFTQEEMQKETNVPEEKKS